MPSFNNTPNQYQPQNDARSPGFGLVPQGQPFGKPPETVQPHVPCVFSTGLYTQGRPLHQKSWSTSVGASNNKSMRLNTAYTTYSEDAMITYQTDPSALGNGVNVNEPVAFGLV